MEFPSARRLDVLAARGALRPTTLFDNVGYGAVPIFRQGPAEYVSPTGAPHASWGSRLRG